MRGVPLVRGLRRVGARVPRGARRLGRGWGGVAGVWGWLCRVGDRGGGGSHNAGERDGCAGSCAATTKARRLGQASIGQCSCGAWQPHAKHTTNAYRAAQINPAISPQAAASVPDWSRRCRAGGIPRTSTYPKSHPPQQCDQRENPLTGIRQRPHCELRQAA